jgi:hypothetical protein
MVPFSLPYVGFVLIANNIVEGVSPLRLSKDRIFNAI